MRQLIAANWKMNGDLSWVNKPAQLTDALTEGTVEKTDLLICPPLSILAAMNSFLVDKPINLGAQNCHAANSGAYTGEVSASMVAQCGASYVILGHSERREYFKETDAEICEKAASAHREALITIICVGESLEQRESGEALDVVSQQLSKSVPEDSNSVNTVIAYEPIWAIGTGKVPSSEDIVEMHTHIRQQLTEKVGQHSADDMHILYGGSVKPTNAKEILGLVNVDGALVGGASLEMESFAAIANAARPYAGL